MRYVKDKVNKIDAVIADLKNIQVWHIENGKEKNPLIKFNIEYASSLREYLLTGTVKSHLGRLGGTYKFKNDVERYYLIEDSDKRSVRSFVRKMNHIAFDNFRDMDRFRTLTVRSIDTFDK